MLRLLALIIAIATILPGKASAVTPRQRGILTSQNFTYFVDSTRGKNANNGRSPNAPLLDVTSLPTLLSGQKIGLARGSHWREMLTVSVNNITVGSYGAGALPILDASDIIVNAGLTKTAGYANVYNTGTITFNQGGQTGWINVFETGGTGDNATGSFLTYVTSESLVDTTPCSYFLSTLTTIGTIPATGVLYIHSCDSTSPITNGYLYEFSNRQAGLAMTSLHGVAKNIEGRKNAFTYGALQFLGDGNAYLIDGVIARDGGIHNTYIPGGTILKNSLIIDAYFSSSGSNFGNLFVFFENTPSGLGAILNGNIFQQDQQPPGAGASVGIAHSSTGGAIGTLTFTNNWMIAQNGASLSGLGLSNPSSVSTSGNYASQLMGFATPFQNWTSSNDWYISSTANNNPWSFSAVQVSISNGRWCVGQNQNGFMSITGAGATVNMSGNLIYFPSQGGVFPFSVVMQDAFGSTAITANGNDFGTALQGSGWYIFNNFGGPGSTFSGNNNIYESANTTTTNWALNGTNYTSLSAWQTATGQDAASTTSGGNASNACTFPVPIPSVTMNDNLPVQHRAAA